MDGWCCPDLSSAGGSPPAREEQGGGLSTMGVDTFTGGSVASGCVRTLDRSSLGACFVASRFFPHLYDPPAFRWGVHLGRLTSKLKLSYAVQLSVSEVCRLSRSPVLATFTFSENITDKAEAETRWHRLRERLRRRSPDLNAVGVWQRQARGAWHLHLVMDRFLSVEWLRPSAVACGFGTFINLRPINRNGFRQFSSEQVGRYVARYLTRDTPAEDKGVRLVAYLGNAHRATVRFAWARGLHALWRNGRSEFWELFQRLPTSEDWWFIVRLGWELLSPENQRIAFETNRAVRSWWDPEGHPPDPF